MENYTKVIIAGGRDFDNYEYLKEVCLDILKDIDNVCIVSGKAKGADSLGEQFAKEHAYMIESYPADWNRYGKTAGFIRNEEMAKTAAILIAFWDGKSHGTKHMINTAKLYNLRINIIKYKIQ